MRRRPQPAAAPADPPWFKEAIVYELHVRAFADSNADGVGDLRGLVDRLDYLADLGVTALWLLPFYPSPLRDGGYDIADYTSINPAYGTLADFRRLLREAHRRGMEAIRSTGVPPWTERVVVGHGLTKDGQEVPVSITLSGWQDKGSWMLSAEVRRRQDRPVEEVAPP